MASAAASAANVVREYTFSKQLKYGCNPHQAPANIYSIGNKMPFTILNGTPGYINLLDALNAWQLVKELKEALNLPAAASFKHVSPAGVGVALPLSQVEKEAYELGDKTLSPLALAYLRARNADPLCSFGDFAALSDPVDDETANILKTEVSDGIIAPAFSEKALEILKAKKQGGYIILQADPSYEAPEQEYREVYGVVFSQKRNSLKLNSTVLFKEFKTNKKEFPPEAIRDLVVASIAIKYTQSNSVAYAVNGQCVGIGAGQQSRVDCTKLAGRKVATWYLRQHPKVRALKFKKTVKKQERINARVAFIEGDLTLPEKKVWLELFEDEPAPLTAPEKEEWLKTLTGVSISSDAFFPFRDNIDQASKFGASYVVQPGGSVADQAIIDACNDYGMVMAFSGVRLFHH